MTASIESLVRGLMLRHHLWQALGVLLSHALAAGLVLLAVGAWLPLLLEAALWAGGGWLCYVLLRELLRLALGRRRLRVRDVDRGLRMQDTLATLWLCRRQDALGEWLRRDVSSRLARLPERHRRRLWRGACLRALALLPLVALVIWLGPLGSLLPAGLEPSGDRGPSGQDEKTAREDRDPGKPAAGEPGAPAAPGKAGEAAEEEAAEQEAAVEEPPWRRPGTGDPQRPPGKSPPPKRLMPSLPVQKEFVVPTWIHEGPSTKARAPVADVPEPGGRRTDPERQPPRRPGPPPLEGPPLLVEFRRAAERAQHARHVPPAERPFVRRYFGELVESGRRR